MHTIRIKPATETMVCSLLHNGKDQRQQLHSSFYQPENKSRIQNLVKSVYAMIPLACLYNHYTFLPKIRVCYLSLITGFPEVFYFSVCLYKDLSNKMKAIYLHLVGVHQFLQVTELSDIPIGELPSYC